MMDGNRTDLHAYTIEVRRQSGVFYLSIPDLGLVSSGSDIGQAYRDIEARQLELVAHHRETKTMDRLPPPREGRLRRELTPFFIKAATVALVGVVMLSVASLSFSYAVRTTLKNDAQNLGRLVINQVVAGLDEALAKEINPEQEAKIRAMVRQAVPRLKPYADELRPLFEAEKPAR